MLRSFFLVTHGHRVLVLVLVLDLVRVCDPLTTGGRLIARPFSS